MKLPVYWLLFWFTPALILVFVEAMGFYSLNFELPHSLQSPSWLHPFGFDSFGRDFFLLNLHASGWSGLFGAFTVLFTCAISIFFGVLLAFAPRRIRFFGERFLDLLLAFPSLLLSLGWAAVSGPGWDTLMVSLSIGTFPSFTRLVFARTRELLAEDYVKAAEALGSNPIWIARRHFFPALFSLCSIKIPNLFASAILAEATLSFLGVGAPIGSNTWGSLLAQGKDYLVEAPHLTMGVGIPLFFSVLSFQLMSEYKTEKHFRLYRQTS